ncbi:ABC transporter permease [Chloracidobacterium validum]|uniref:ABC transporter permease n=1 Tax=Chloracidobacterium validum TaxID=2821543 RepID=A0ABX8BB76_9BACT|nr:ABC transporter permease [Chloracidobacterium validum]QUW02795.1 ABC transporter permease [Chloracidobacterium validum]
MQTLTVIYRNLRQRWLSTCLTAISIALGVALVTAITSMRQQAQANFDNVAASYELVVGAKGSPLQLVLNTVFHLDVPVGNLPYDYYRKLKADDRVAYAIPLALGDNYRGFRLVGTEREYFELVKLKDGQPVSIAEGRAFTADYEAVIGSVVAREAKLALGQTFVARHGVEDTVAAEEHEDAPFTVVGVLRETGTPLDRVIFISLGSVDEIHRDSSPAQNNQNLLDQLNALPAESDTTASPPEAEDKHHHHHHHHKKPSTAPATTTAPTPSAPPMGDKPAPTASATTIDEVTSIIVKLRSPGYLFLMQREINKGKDAQAALPGVEVQKLFAIVGTVDRALLLMSVLVVVVASVSVLVAIYNSLAERRREVAVLRALGAHRRTIFGWLVWEAAITAALGGLAGVVGGHLLLAAAGSSLKFLSGLPLAPWTWTRLEVGPAWLTAYVPFEVAVVAGTLALGAVMGLLPAALAYRTNVARHLSD